MPFISVRLNEEDTESRVKDTWNYWGNSKIVFHSRFISKQHAEILASSCLYRIKKIYFLPIL